MRSSCAIKLLVWKTLSLKGWLSNTGLHGYCFTVRCDKFTHSKIHTTVIALTFGVLTMPCVAKFCWVYSQWPKHLSSDMTQFDSKQQYRFIDHAASTVVGVWYSVGFIMCQWRGGGLERRLMGKKKLGRRRGGACQSCCKRIDLLYGSNCMNWFTPCSPKCRTSIAERALWEFPDQMIRVSLKGTIKMNLYPILVTLVCKHFLKECFFSE